MNGGSVLGFLVLVISTSITGIFLKYILDLEKKDNCECSKNKKRDFIKYYLMVSLGFSALSLLRLLTGFKFTSVVYKLFVSLFSFASLVNVVMMYLYTRELKKIECVCSEDWKRGFMNHYALFGVILYPALLFILLIGKIFGVKK